MAGKKVRILAIVVASIGVVCLAGIAALMIAFPPSRIKGLVVPQVEKLLGRRVTVDKAGISLFPSVGVSLKGLSIAETGRAGFASGDFLSIGAFEVRVGLAPLLRRRLDIRKIRIERPYVRVQVDTAGSYNFDDLAVLAKKEGAPEKPKESKGVGLPLPLSLRQLTIIGGTVEYLNAKTGQNVVIGSIHEQLALAADRAMENVTSTGEIVLTDISLKTGESARPIRDLSFTLRHDVAVDLVKGEAAINSVRLSLQDIYLNASGSLTGLQSGLRYDLAITTDTMALEKLIAAIPADLVPSLAGAKGSGGLFLKVSAKSGTDSAAAPDVAGTLNVWDGVIQYPGLPESIRDMRANIGFTLDKVAVSPLSLKLGSNPIVINGSVENFKKPFADAVIDATVNMGDLKNIVKLPEGNALDGVVKAAITVKGLADAAAPEKLDVKGSVQLSQVRVQTPAITKPALFNGTIQLTSRQISPAITIDIASSKISFNAGLANYLSLVLPDSTKKMPRPKLDFRMSANMLNTNEFMPQEEKAAPAAAKPPSLLLPAPLPGIDVTGTITTGRLTYQDFELSNLSMKYTMINDVMTVTTRTGVFDGTLNQNLTVNAADIRNLTAKSTIKLDRVEISRILSATKNWLGDGTRLNRELKKLDKHLYGQSDVAIDFTTRGGTMPELTKNLEATVNSRLVNGRIAGGEFIERISGPLSKLKIMDLKDVEFREFRLNAKIKDEKVHLADVAIGSPSTGDWKAAGILGFDASMGVDLTNRLPVGISGVIAKGKNALASAAKGALDKTPLARASGLIDNLGPRPDKEGRYTIQTKLAGSLPKFTVDGFKFLDGGGAAEQKSADSPKEVLTEQVQQKVEQAKEAVQQKAGEIKTQAETEVKKTVETGKKKALDMLKKKF